MISSENLIGVPLLVLANKQDIPECMGVREVKPIFNQSADLIGRRDCMVMPVSALTGWVLTSFFHSFVSYCKSDWRVSHVDLAETDIIFRCIDK
ncbi:ADP-ribosylation factor-related protein 1 [Portunus trituberculatus]|uniref:ADP-ribosylation factor-related protein 1 n=1 Tax=Portunus trituberculatus TaxID=210409 RepID=A0A5B7JRG7_PORTR|nr:ADP-ribosylation factor-related protein 1 [Portunus trituberculatus]